ncbi:Jacalin-related lectin 3 [Linum grandiflorum]
MVRSLTFETNKTKYGPYGVEQGTYFSLPTNGGKIVSFHGRGDWYVDAIGIKYQKSVLQQKPKAPPAPLVHANYYNVNGGADNLGYSVIQGSAGNNYDIVVAVRQKSHDSPLNNNNQNKNNAVHSTISPPKQSPLLLETNKAPPGTLEKASKIREQPAKITEGYLKHGPWGGQGGSAFDDGIYSGIRQIYVSRNVGIVYLRAQYDRDGQPVWGSRHGGTGGFKTDKIVFDYPQEILTHITGTYGPLMHMGPNIVKSLTFFTNKGKHGPFGEEHGPSFFTKVNEGRIVGFHGREGLFLDAIGVHVKEGIVMQPKSHLSDAIVKFGGTAGNNNNVAEIENSPWSNKLVLAKQGQAAEQVSYGVVKESVPFGPGPWGGDGGRPWDDGVFSGIQQIFLTRTLDAICSIQIEYDRSGQSVWSVKHGTTTGTSTHRVKLDYPHETLLSISGYYGPTNREDKLKVVRSLSFQTSRGKLGPFGEEVGTFFTSSTAEGKVVGFHGRSGAYLDAIGLHMQYWLGSNKPIRTSMFKRYG